MEIRINIPGLVAALDRGFALVAKAITEKGVVPERYVREESPFVRLDTLVASIARKNGLAKGEILAGIKENNAAILERYGRHRYVRREDVDGIMAQFK